MLRSVTRRNAQVAFEFVLLVAILFTALMVFTSFVRDSFSDVRSDTTYYRLKDVALAVKSEIELATSLSDGYERDFFVPLTADGVEYNITKEAGSILFSSAGGAYSVTVPTFTGNVTKGNNVIKKVNGVIEVNT